MRQPAMPAAQAPFACSLSITGLWQADNDMSITDLRARHALRIRRYGYAAAQYRQSSRDPDMPLSGAQHCLVLSKLALRAALPDSLAAPFVAQVCPYSLCLAAQGSCTVLQESRVQTAPFCKP